MLYEQALRIREDIWTFPYDETLPAKLSSVDAALRGKWLLMPTLLRGSLAVTQQAT